MAEGSNKVYIVTQGSYSDYHIVTVFTNRKDAEVYCAVHNGSYGCDSYEVEEVEIGSIEYQPDKQIGYAFETEAYGKLSFRRYFMPKVGRNAIVPNVVKESKWRGRTEYAVAVMATSMEQAEKIAQDLIAKYKAEKEGVTI